MPLFRVVTVAALIILILNLANGAHARADGGDDQTPLIPEKTELRYPNLGSRLDQLAAQVEEGEATAEDAAGEAPMHREESVAVTIYLSGSVDEVVAFLEENGGDPRNVGEDYIEAYVPVPLLGPVSEQPGVIRVREIVPPEPDFGDFTSQGVQAHLAGAWHQDGYNGQGIKVGIIDSGFEGFEGLMGTELPATVQARCYTELGRYTTNLADCENDSFHGTASAENVMDIAPEASLYILSGSYSWGDFRDTIKWMISKDVSVINRSLGGGYEGPGDGTSPFRISRLSIIDQAVEGGIIFLNSAGNQARVTWFQDGPPSIHDPDGDGYGFIEFAEGDVTNSVGYRDSRLPGQQLPEGREIWAYLRWEDTWTWPGASTDLDLYLVDSDSAEIIDKSEDDRLGEEWGIPTESLYTKIPRDGQYHLSVVYRGGNLPDWVQLTAPKVSLLEHRSEGYSINGPSESANPGMLAVGATHYWDTHTIADYSSRGPTPTGRVRVKPDIVGAACGETASYEPNLRDGNQCWFSGTSSASPHVAGLAALVRQRFPDMGPVEVAEYLKENAAQREAPDPNNTWGHGFAVLPPTGGCSNNPGLATDCAALLAAQDILAGNGTLNWSANAPVTTWDGVTVGGSPLRVTELRLSEKGLSGEIPAELGGLSKLVELVLWGNELSGTIPAELGSLANLEELWLSENQLTGTIPVELGGLVNLEELYLRDNQLSGTIPTQLGNLTSLERLSISRNQLTGTIPAELGSLASLERLYLWENELTGEIPAELGNLAKLERLSISQNQLTGEIPAELGSLTSLTTLALGGNQLSGTIPTWLGSLANLEGLYLWENELTGEIPSELGGLTSLKELSLTRNQLSGEIPPELGGLANLEELLLWENELTGEIPSELGSLTSLKELSLTRNQLTGEIPAELGSLASLEGLRLHNNQLIGEIPSELGGLTSLKELSLARNQLSGEIPAELAVLANLEELYLGGNQLSGTIPTWLGSLVNLEELHLWGNELTGKIPVELGSLANLRRFSLGDNQLSGEIPSELGSLTNLAHLRLHNNQLTGEIPVELGRLTNLTVLRLSGNQLTGCIPSGWQDVDDNDFNQLGLSFCDPLAELITRYDTNRNGVIDRSEVIRAINDYLFGEGEEAISRSDVIKLINLYLFG